MREHGLVGWRVKITKGRSRLGACSLRKNLIMLSGVMAALATDDEVRNVILHEIAHALTPKDAGHGPLWRAMARAIGCDAKRTSAIPIPRLWIGTCPTCGQQFRKNARRRAAVCPRCYDGEANQFCVLVWTRNTEG
jgi:predicted SprT family Zn-dependent metalloprotease